MWFANRYILNDVVWFFRYVGHSVILIFRTRTFKGRILIIDKGQAKPSSLLSPSPLPFRFRPPPPPSPSSSLHAFLLRLFVRKHRLENPPAEFCWEICHFFADGWSAALIEGLEIARIFVWLQVFFSGLWICS